MKICGAKRRGTDLLCRKAAVDGSDRCRLHGGRSLSGLASPSMKSGRYSKHLPTRLAEKYEQALTDPELLSVRSEIALLDSKICEQLDAANRGENADVWEQLHDTMKAYDSARGTDAEQQQQDAIERVWRLLETGGQDEDGWREIRQMLQERKTLCESERKRIVEMQLSMTAQQAGVLLGAVLHIIMQTMDELKAELMIVAPADADRIVKEALQAISASLNALVNHDG